MGFRAKIKPLRVPDFTNYSISLFIRWKLGNFEFFSPKSPKFGSPTPPKVWRPNDTLFRNMTYITLCVRRLIWQIHRMKNLGCGLSRLWIFKISNFWGRVEHYWESTLSIKQFLSVFADIKTRLAFQVPIILKCWPIIKWSEHFRKFSSYTGFTFCIWIYGGLRAT